MNEEVFRAVGDMLQRGESAALVTVIRTQGSTPQRVGAKMLVFPDGRSVGTIGGGCYENDAFWKARRALQTRQPLVAKYELADDLAEESGLICGGQMEVYIEPLEAAPHLYLVGRWSRGLPPGPTRLHGGVPDSRASTTGRSSPTRSAFPDAVEVAVDNIPEWLNRTTRSRRNAYVVILTRGHRHDLDALRALATRKLRYLGLIGSRAKVARLHEALSDEGCRLQRPRRVARSGRSRHRGRVAAGDRRQHSRRADRGQVRQAGPRRGYPRHSASTRCGGCRRRLLRLALSSRPRAPSSRPPAPSCRPAGAAAPAAATAEP